MKTSLPAGARLDRIPHPAGVSYVVCSARESVTVGDGAPAFTIRVPTLAAWNRIWRLDAYRAALAFLRGEFDISGDVVAAIKAWSHAAHPARIASSLYSLSVRLRPERLWQTRAHAKRNIAFHYDRSNDFFQLFLDRRMVYSCAYFEQPGMTLENAQEAKLDLVCRKLDINRHDTFLDVGCGWGALVTWAVERFGARGVGCTLSRAQHDAGVRIVGERGLTDRARIELGDYRDMTGRFTKIASVGMVEHVGRSRLRGYFATLADRLDDTGLLLNHGIARPSTLGQDAESHFLQQRVFPGGELVSIGDMITAAEHAGFEALDVENLRPHYALTCGAWVSRLRANEDACVQLVGQETYRTWLLYLAASSAGFSEGTTEVFQVLFAKRGDAGRRRMSRRYMFAPAS